MRHFFSYFSILVLFTFSSVFCFEVSPISVSLSPTGSESSKLIKLTNAEDAPKPIQMAMVTRNPDLSGIEQHESAEDNFLVYPAQFILPAKSSKVVRISWIGNPKLEKELAYRFIVEDLNVNLEDPNSKKQHEKKSKIKLLMKYEGALYITPPGSESHMVLESAQKDADSKLVLTFHNQGTLHQVLNNPTHYPKRKQRKDAHLIPPGSKGNHWS